MPAGLCALITEGGPRADTDPSTLAIGQGSGIQQPLAIAVIAGLLLQYPLVLFAMPVLIRLTV